MAAAVDVRTQRPLVMTAGDATLLVDASAGIPRVLYWGKAVQLSEADLAALGSLTAGQWTVDGVQRVVTSSVLPEQSAGWMGTPGLEGHRNGTRFSTRFDATGANSGTGADGEQFLDLHAVDEVAELGLHTRIEMLPSGLVRLSARLANLAAQTDAPHINYTLEALRIALPLPAEATEILDFAGRHLRERSPQRHPFVVGTHLREGRRGRSGSDSTVLLAAGTSGFTFGTGEVWAVHTAWSGNHATFAELGLTGTRLIGGGELLLPGEIVLGPGESYQSPFIYAAYGEGLDAVASAFHTHLRTCAPAPPIRTRRARLCSTPGRRSTSTRISRRLLSSPRSARASASSGSCLTTAGSATGTAIGPVSVIGRSIRRCGRRDSGHWCATCAHSGCSLASGSSRR